MYLHSTLQDLDHEWRQVENVVVDSRDVWNDSTRTQFEDRDWRDIHFTMTGYLDNLRELADTIQYVTEHLPCR